VRQWYEPYGEVRWSTGALPTDYGFTGQRHDESIHLIQMGARWYDARIGRWISADTIVPDPGNPRDLNRFTYCGDNPVIYVDPTGHMLWAGGGGEMYPWKYRARPEHIWDPALVTYVETHVPETAPQLAQVASAGVDFLPWIGDAKGLAEVFTGSDLVTGESLGNWRWLGLLGVAELRHIDEVADLARSVRHSDEAVDVIQCTGQWHHIISRKIERALAGHATLAGEFRRQDYVVRALDEASHKGYQTWHRAYDDEVVRWLRDARNNGAGSHEFLTYLGRIHATPDMSTRFPDAYRVLQMALEVR